MSQYRERRELSRRAKLDRLEEQVRDGSLVIRQASETEREGWARSATTGPVRSFMAGPGLSDAGARLPQRTPNPDQLNGGDDDTDRGPTRSFTGGSGSNGAGGQQGTPTADLEQDDGDD